MAKKYEMVSVEEIVKMASETAAKVTLEEHERLAAAEREAFNDRRIRRTKKILRDYRSLKAAAQASVHDSAKAVTEDAIVAELMSMRDTSRIESIAYSAQRTETLLTHIDVCLSAFRRLCEATGKDRQWRVIDGLYISNIPFTADELAEREYMTVRSIYNEAKAATETLAVIFFGAAC